MKSKKKLIITSISIIAICIAFIGLSYAYWYVRNIQNSTNNATTGCFQVELANQSGEINLGNAYPITDEEGLKLKPFSFTIHNTCSIFAHYYVNIELLEGTTLNSHYVATRVNNEEIKTLDTFTTTLTTLTNSVSSYTVAEGYLGSDESEDYSVSLWIDEDVTVDDDIFGKFFKSKVVVNSEPSSYNQAGTKYKKLYDAIFANEYQTTPEIAKNKIASKQTVDVSNTAPIIKWVEKTGNSATLDIPKPASSAIKSDEQTSELTEDDTKITLFKSKNFDSDTGRYTLSDPVCVDPTTLDFSGNQKYYFQYEYLVYNNVSHKLHTSSGNVDAKVYEITNVTKETGTKIWNDISYDSIIYSLTGITLTESESETDKSDRGLYQGTDDYGTTYYYRGNIKNNNVYFAGFYWQIIRINGDDSIRLMYNGTVKNAIGIHQSINDKGYLFNSLSNDPAYIGYMYGNVDGKTYDEVHANTNDSTIKQVIDNWYKTNIVDKNYDAYVSRAVGFCGDRSLYSDSGSDGVTTEHDTRFGASKRHGNSTAEFTCPEPSRDLYTVTDSNIGNKALTYPVGLITYDEVVFAGIAKNYLNRLSWVYSTQNYWTMSPSYFSSSEKNSRVFSVNQDGSLGVYSWANSTYVTRPVINLKADVEISGGIGTSNDPFVIKTN